MGVRNWSVNNRSRRDERRGDGLARRRARSEPPAEHERHAHDRRAGRRRQHGLLALELGAAVHELRLRGIVLAHPGALTGGHEVGRDRDEPRAARMAQTRQLRGGVDVGAAGEVGLGLAAIGVRQRCAVHDHLGPCALERGGQRRRGEEVEVDAGQAGGNGGMVPRRHDVMVRRKQLGQPAAQEAARARHQHPSPRR
jgi:hypothetical protein